MKKSFVLKGILLAAVVIFVSGCQEEPANFSGRADCVGCADPIGGGSLTTLAPHISSFSPRKGFARTVVTINGSRFSSTPLDNQVTFDGILAKVISASTSTLVVTVPSGATSGKIVVGVGSLQATSSARFQVIDIPLSGLAAFYPCDGNANDASPNQNHGIVFGAAPATDRNGNVNRSFYLDGDDYLNMGNPPSLRITNEITISIWVNLQTDHGMIYNKKVSTSSPGYNFEFGTNAVRMYGGLHVYPISPVCLTTPFTLFRDNWMSLTVTMSGNENKYYENGLLVRTVSAHCPLPPTSEGDFLVGNAVHLGWEYLIGYVDDIAIYNRTLTEAEVLTLHNQPIIP